MAISDKLNYLLDTKQLFKDRLNSLGTEITSATTFRNYLNWLDTFYGEVSEKTDISINGVVGRTSQETTGKNKYGITSVLTTVYASGLPEGNANNIIVDEYDLNNIKFHTKEAGSYYQVLFPTYQLEPNTSYVITYTRTNNLSEGAKARRFIYSLDNENNYAIIHYLTSGDEGDKSYTFTTTETGKVAIAFGFLNNASVNSSEINNLMIRLSSDTDATFEPYIYDPNPSYPQPINNLTGNVPYKVSRKNKLPFPYTEINKEKNGVTFTINNDGSVLVNGTATNENANIKLYGNWQESQNFKIPGKYLVGGTNNVLLRALHNNAGNYSVLANDTGSGAEIDTSSYDTCYIELTVLEGTTINNELIKPMVVDNLEDTKYEPYISQTFTIPLGDIELCKIDTYEDKIYSNNGRFYLNKNVGNNVFGSTTQVNAVNNTLSSPSEISFSGTYSIIKNTLNANIKNDTMYCNIAKYEYNSNITDNRNAQTYLNDNTMCMRQGQNDRIYFKNSTFTGKTGTQIKSLIEGEKLYYILNNPTTTEITQENYPILYKQLKAIQDFLVQHKINEEFLLGYDSPNVEY